MRLLLTLFLLFSTLQGVEMYEDYETALNIAKKEEKPLLLYLYMRNCHTCEYMNREVFSDAKVMAYLKQHYIVAHLYTNDRSLPSSLRVSLSPVFHFVDPRNGEMIESIIGGRNAQKFLQFLGSSYEAYKEECDEI